MNLCGRVALLLVLSANVSHAAIAVPGADGSDGTLNVTSNSTIDLGLAPSAVWSTPGTGMGVYDSTQWAVVFKYSSVNIAAGRTLTFSNNSSRAPVVWLVNGNVTISGTIQLSGANADGTTIPEPGPGGFPGGAPYLSASSPGSGGFGPGGGIYSVAQAKYGAGSFGTAGQGSAGPIYGSRNLIPLIGGSGGSPRPVAFFTCHAVTSGGAGGGAILIAATGTITVGGSIVANGGYGNNGCFNDGAGGSGGAIRLVAEVITGPGLLRAKGGELSGGDSRLTGGDGRIRLETTLLTLSAPVDPIPNIAAVGTTAQIWPVPSIEPTVRLVSIAGSNLPAELKAVLNNPGVDLGISASDSVSVVIETRNVPTTSLVELRCSPKIGDSLVRAANLVTGTQTLATWIARIKFSPDIAQLQARVHAQ